MGEGIGFSLRRAAPRLVLVGLLGGVSAACSSDVMRFSDTPFSNPFSGSARMEPQSTAAVSAAPTAGVQSQPLPPPGVAAPVSAQPLRPIGSTAPTTVASAPATMPSGPAVPQQKGWTAQGGSTIVLGAGETLKTLSNRYGVPESAIRGANGLGAGSQPAPGTRIVIPVYHAVDASAGAAAPAPLPAPKTVATAAVAAPHSADGKSLHRMQLVKGAQPKGAKAELAEAAPASQAPLPGKLASAKAAPAAPVSAESAKVQVAAAKPGKPAAVAQLPAAQAKATAKPVETEAPAPAAAPAKVASAPAAEPAETTGSVSAQSTGTAAEATTQFRWPARGRVITGFGKGGSNDGINIALPEGTPVKAAEGGVVAYAGNELKGYGNLVLIRHADGWVTAYANNGELKVKRGETVTRGQVVALSGQSGNVSSPQLHFELRKGSTPVDPMPHLAGL